MQIRVGLDEDNQHCRAWVGNFSTVQPHTPFSDSRASPICNRTQHGVYYWDSVAVVGESDVESQAAAGKTSCNLKGMARDALGRDKIHACKLAWSMSFCAPSCEICRPSRSPRPPAAVPAPAPKSAELTAAPAEKCEWVSSVMLSRSERVLTRTRHDLCTYDLTYAIVRESLALSTCSF